LVPGLTAAQCQAFAQAQGKVNPQSFGHGSPLSGSVTPCRGACSGEFKGGIAVWRQQGDPLAAAGFSVAVGGLNPDQALGAYRPTVIPWASLQDVVRSSPIVRISKTESGIGLEFTGSAIEITGNGSGAMEEAITRPMIISLPAEMASPTGATQIRLLHLEAQNGSVVWNDGGISNLKIGNGLVSAQISLTGLYALATAVHN
jgi:hypothetical protein